MKFTKMHGIGNDYIYINCFEEQVVDAPALSRAVSHRHFGVGSDGLILICPSNKADVRMEMYNADGSRGQMCGNGIRCVAKYAYEHGLSRSNPMTVETDSGVKALQLNIVGGGVDSVRVDMGVPLLLPSEIPVRLDGDRVIDRAIAFNDRLRYRVTCVSMGNPHAVIFLDQIDRLKLDDIGPVIETHAMFPRQANVHFVKVLSRSEAAMRTWERGSGATLACGTGACAVLVAGVLNRLLDRTATLHLPGGDLVIEWADNDHVFKTGPAVEIFSGDWEA